MADTKLSALPAVSSAGASARLYASTAGESKAITVADLFGDVPSPLRIVPKEGVANGTITDINAFTIDPTAVDADAKKFTYHVQIKPDENINAEEVFRAYRWGLNIKANALQDDPARTALVFHYEDDWDEFEDGRLFTEFHQEVIDTDGTARRYLSLKWEQGTLSDHTQSSIGGFLMHVVADRFSILGSTGYTNDNLFQVIKDTGAIIHDGTLKLLTNDRAVISRDAAHSAEIQMIKVDAEDYVSLAANGPATGIKTNRNIKLATGTNIGMYDHANAGFNIGSSSEKSIGVSIWSSNADILRFMDGTQHIVLRLVNNGLGVRDDANGLVQWLRFDGNAPVNTLGNRSNGRVFVGGDANPQYGLHIFSAAGGGRLGMQGTTAPPSDPTDGHGVIFFDQSDGQLKVRYNLGGSVLTGTVALS